MASILRSSRLSLRASYSPLLRPASRLTSQPIQPWRGYAHSSYGGEGETKAEQPNSSRNEPTRDLEHPGPPAPDVGGSSKKSQQSGGSSNSGSKDTGHGTGTGVENKSHSKTTPSNKARPTITDGENSPNAEVDGTVGDNASEDVKKHNREMDQRYDHAYNQVEK
ncbi:hypothetical protein BO86DRAFT_80432 [Aspergillus japonicus CBS 114.51]|uniref:Uncharacterized protein n=2 Tax=Aspergillus TaxID=5052 RepID=A0A2V5HGV9_ASPV1|nr:hypothetical protein BO86DRAFT_80432 [Aspergillus japonicus CBS 114.51]PYI20533.1 hypothetical protein BO99DRAFT_107193 [Aspergillus violaceofuscus CBS 115571]RAH87204.1 hypothetical protein BO86DRAFT_80432 [Aspergillus japonicus CBS 114.51]